MQDNTQKFYSLDSLSWCEVFYDSGTECWMKNWFLDGLNAKVCNTSAGMEFYAGNRNQNDDDHAVLWSRQVFKGDIKIEYDYMRLDSSSANTVNILYIQATGEGTIEFDKDIALWSAARTVPAMRLYFDHMNTYHISYAADGLPPAPESKRYVRARRYMPSLKQGLRGTALMPEYDSVPMFETGVPYHITVIKYGAEIYMKATGGEKETIFYFEGTTLPPITEGRVGLRQMYTRAARYSGFRVMVLE